MKKEITKADSEINRDQTIIKEYKQVSSLKILNELSDEKLLTLGKINLFGIQFRLCQYFSKVLFKV